MAGASERRCCVSAQRHATRRATHPPPKQGSGQAPAPAARRCAAPPQAGRLGRRRRPSAVRWLRERLRLLRPARLRAKQPDRTREQACQSAASRIHALPVAPIAAAASAAAAGAGAPAGRQPGASDVLACGASDRRRTPSCHHGRACSAQACRRRRNTDATPAARVRPQAPELCQVQLQGRTAAFGRSASRTRPSERVQPPEPPSRRGSVAAVLP